MENRARVAVARALAGLSVLSAVAGRFPLIPFEHRCDALRLAAEAGVAAVLADAAAFRAPGLPALLRRRLLSVPVFYVGRDVDDAKAARLLRGGGGLVHLPCGPLEFLAHVETAVLRTPQVKPEREVVVDLAALRVHAGDVSITLRHDEAAVLACLAGEHPRCVPGTELRRRALRSCGGSGPVRTHLWAIHARLRQAGAARVVVESVRGVGYRFGEEVQIVPGQREWSA